MTDTALRTMGVRHLQEKFGLVDAERFIALIITEPFDYTKWRDDLFDDLSLEELAEEAQKFCDKQA